MPAGILLGADRRQVPGKGVAGGHLPRAPSGKAAARPRERVLRHALFDRLYHWLMAASVLTLMGSAFLPIVGFKFEWLSLHWMTGIGLTLLVLIESFRKL